MRTVFTGALYVIKIEEFRLTPEGTPPLYPLEFVPQAVPKLPEDEVEASPPLTVVVICALAEKENSTKAETTNSCFINKLLRVLFIFGGNISIDNIKLWHKLSSAI